LVLLIKNKIETKGLIFGENMKLKWLTAKDLIGKYNLPNTVQGLTKKARNENWQKRKIKGQKGGGFEYEVSDIINKFELLQNYEKGFDKRLHEQSPSYNIELPRLTAFKERLKLLIGNNSSLGFAQKCGISESVLRKYLKGESEPTLSKLIAISRACEIPVNWLATGDIKDYSTDTASNDSYVIIPHLTSILFPNEDKKEPPSGMMDIRENFVLSKYWLLKTGLFNSRLAIIRASNDTMTPTINEGDIALLNVQEEALHNILNGIYLLKIKESYVIYRLQQDLNTNTIHIINDNKAYKSFTIKLDNADSHIKVIAKVEMILTSPYK
jgi:transcriptional regulator with XRE-family HTH domain